MISLSHRPSPDNTEHSEEKNIHDPDGIWTTLPTSERPQAYGLDRADNGVEHYKFCIGPYVKYLLFFSDFNETRIFSTILQKY